jgi:hypothetical protein
VTESLPIIPIHVGENVVARFAPKEHRKLASHIVAGIHAHNSLRPERPPENIRFIPPSLAGQIYFIRQHQPLRGWLISEVAQRQKIHEWNRKENDVISRAVH